MYIASLIYSIIRTVFVIKTEENNSSENSHVLFNLFLSFAFLSMYLISRVHIAKVREAFLREKNINEVLEILNRIFQTSQDGIVITANDNIIMYNVQTNKIFEEDTTKLSPIKPISESPNNRSPPKNP
jgi:hypothetical protein